ncbi:MAG: hypothetical protein O7G32_14410 [SAR324 cluster bacterium]|nr:hypothetical protein [SAR324 cluster bacterium]
MKLNEAPQGNRPQELYHLGRLETYFHPSPGGGYAREKLKLSLRPLMDN